ncbi:glycoside hydrolase family 32 protein [Paenibacillus athensensis]|nr:glycoside hydrolase family 32 protein [Paenibacillus athensensis]
MTTGANAGAYREKYRPQYHFTPPTMWMNDPNGMVYFEGEYHLFYQHHPDGMTWGPMHWGHAVSRDLVHWEHLPIALAPDGNGAIFSGSAVVDWTDSCGLLGGRPGLVALFTHADHYPGSTRPRQRQSLAYSTDRGRTWTMYAGNPVLSDERFTDFRDPKVIWYEPGAYWVMVLAAGDRVRLYTSGDLKAWTFASEFGADEGSHDGVWECPDLIELPVEGSAGQRKWALLVSIGDHPELADGSKTQYFVGSFDGLAFVNEASAERVLWLDHGRDNYAGVTWADAPRDGGRKVAVGWMSNWKYANQTPTSTWRSAMTLPRELSLRETPEGLRLVQRPISELQGLRQAGREVLLRDAAVEPGENLLAGVCGDVYELVCELEPGTAAEIGFKLRTSAEEETVIGYRAAEQTLIVDRRRSGESSFHDGFACRHELRVPLRKGRLRLQLFVDQSSVELFVHDGEIVLTDQIFPDPASTGLALYAEGGEGRAVELQLYPLKSMYALVGV